MPHLTNPKYEAFAQGLATGMSATSAYARAGYKPNRSHAARLVANGNIKGRVAELQQEAAAKTTDAISFEAVDLFKRLSKRIEAAAEAGDHKSAIAGEQFIIRCFGYEDSPTLTHEHIRGKPLEPRNSEAEKHEGNGAPVLRFQNVLEELRRQTADRS